MMLAGHRGFDLDHPPWRLGLSFRALRCHPRPFACHSERSEESRSAAQGKLREGPVL